MYAHDVLPVAAYGQHVRITRRHYFFNNIQLGELVYILLSYPGRREQPEIHKRVPVKIPVARFLHHGRGRFKAEEKACAQRADGADGQKAAEGGAYFPEHQ